MRDVFHIPGDGLGDIQIFTAGGGANDWKVWEKPRGKTMLSMHLKGAGGGGGAGLTGTVASSRGGGGGGASGSLTSLIIPLILVPDRLYLLIPSGGLGGASSGNAGATPTGLFVTIIPSTADGRNRFLACNSGGGGVAGTSAGSNAGGTAAAALGVGSMMLCSLGIINSFAGNVGAASGAITVNVGAAGVATTALTSLALSGGGGGGTTGIDNVDFAGGAIIGAGMIPTIAGGIAGGGVGGFGFWMRQPWCSSGGSGGGTNGLTGVGGVGGNGAIGSGGGGGGGGVTGGAGGRGGDGEAILTCW